MTATGSAITAIISGDNDTNGSDNDNNDDIDNTDTNDNFKE